MISARESAELVVSKGKQIGLGASGKQSNEQPTRCSEISGIQRIGITIPLITAAVLIPTSLSFANDSFARLGAGGITFVKTDDVRILEEVLTISTDLIRVKYRFLNESDQDIQTTVAFPLPLRGRRSGVRYRGDIIETSEKIRRSFSVRVNGRSVGTRYHRKAVIGDEDITAQLRKVGLSDRDIFETFAGYHVNTVGRIGWDLPLEQKSELKKLLGELTRGHSPWKVAETLHWEQLFPAKKELIVEHTYTPMPGGRYDVPYQGSGDYVMEDTDGIHFLRHDPCLDIPTKKKIINRFNALITKGVGWITIQERNVEYVLGTGRNWSGSIGVFRLRVKKTTPDQFVSVCFPGVHKEISPTIYEWVRKHYVPQNRLSVDFIKVEPGPCLSDQKLNDDELRLLANAYSGGVQIVGDLLDNGVDVNVKSQAGWTPLMWAVEGGQAELVKAFLDRGALIHEKNKKGWTALKLAQANGFSDIEALLKGRGAKE